MAARVIGIVFMKVVAGNSNRALAEAIAAYLATPLTRVFLVGE